MDTTGLHNLESLYRLAEKEKIRIVLSGVNEEVHKVLMKSELSGKIGEENICSNIQEAVEKANAMVEK